MLPITLAMFTSTKGHFGKDTYRYTVEHLDLSLFENKVVHIKWEEGNLGKLIEMSTYFESKGLKVINTKGEWKHFDKSHFAQHSSDIGTLTHSKEVQSLPYILWCEDDIVIKTDNLSKRIEEALDYIYNNPEKTCVRILDREDILQSMQIIEEEKNNNILSHKDTFSFRCNIMRARDAYILGSFMKNGFLSSNMHIERYATEVLRLISGHEIPFACFNLSKIKHIHIGSESFDSSLVY